MNALFRAAADVLAFCAFRRWRCCVIGGLAVQRWGEPRQTRDVDLTLLTGLGGEERFIDELRPLLELKEDDEGEPALRRLFAKHPAP